jgi:hypothetical protein
MAEQGVRRRRSRLEVDRLVSAYESSGLTQREFCAQQGVGLATLSRYRLSRRDRQESGGSKWVAVEVGGSQQQRRGEPELAVVLTSGVRIEVGSGFDAGTLRQLVRALEQD